VRKRTKKLFAILDSFVVEKAPLVIVIIENNTFNAMTRHILLVNRVMIVVAGVMVLKAMMVARLGGRLGGRFHPAELTRLPKHTRTP